MKIRTSEEIRLKALLTADEILQGEIKKRTKKMVLSKDFYIERSKSNYRTTLGILKNCLDENKSLWLDLAFCYKNPVSQFLVHSDAKPKIFLFGRRDFILEHIQEIVGRILAGNRWVVKKAGISCEQEFCIKDFI